MIRVLCNADDPGCYADLDWTRQVAAQSNFKADPFGAHPVYVREFAHDAVVSEREMNGYDDSDFYATYYDAEAGEFKECCYASTRGWTYPAGAVVDATPEIMAKYKAKIEADRAAARAAAIAREAKTVRLGKMVRILPNRGKAKAFIGQVGKVVWLQEQTSQYGTWSYGVRIGVQFGAKRVYLQADKAEVVSEAEMEAQS